jgi:hypothetical protein
VNKNEISFFSKPIFLVGAERSGTTVLRLMLDSHPQISWCFEFEYAVDLISKQGEFPDLNIYYEWLEIHRIFQATGFEIDRNLSYPQLIDSFLKQRREKTAKPIVGATVHRNFDRLLNVWSDARFIHILRDGRDVARSCIGMGWAGNVWVGVERWIESELLWQELQAKLSPERYLNITYEELISNSRKTLEKVCDFIDVPYNEAMLNYPQHTSYDLPDASYIKQWQRKMSNWEIRLVESRIAPMLEERGYPLSGLPFLKVSPLMKMQLFLQNWFACLQFRFKRYGLKLVWLDYLTRKFGIKQWQKYIVLKINRIDTALIK